MFLPVPKGICTHVHAPDTPTPILKIIDLQQQHELNPHTINKCGRTVYFPLPISMSLTVKQSIPHSLSEEAAHVKMYFTYGVFKTFCLG